MKSEPTTGERLPIFSKQTNKLLGRGDAQGVYFWEKLTKSWELWTWEELERFRTAQREQKRRTSEDENT